MSGIANNELKMETSTSVLIVDDESYVRDLTTRWLTAEGCTCARAENAQGAWEHLQGGDVHLVTLDINMPGHPGIELLHDIKETYPDTAVIMMTAVRETETAVAALTCGASGYLVKPVEREEFLLQVRNALERRQLIIEKRDYTCNLERTVREQTIAIRRAYEETIHRLVVASTYRDEETGAHIKSTGICSKVLAEAAGWPPAKVEHLRIAAPMHDLGKIGIPDAVLRKPGRLTPGEFEIIKRHTVIGANMLADSDSPMLQMAKEIALNHHERWDGEGYPAGLAGPAIPESARIVAIVDVYDALTRNRVYRPAPSEEEALGIIRQGRGTHFDPVLLDHFFSVLPEIRRIARENRDEPVGIDLIERVRSLIDIAMV